MKSQYSVSLKFFSLLLISSFLCQELAFAAPQIQPISVSFLRAPLPSFDIPMSVATLKDSFRADGQKTLIIMEDAHTNESGQLNSASAIEAIVKKEKINHIFLEAGTGNDSLSSLRKQVDYKTRQVTAKEFLKKGYLSGAEYLDLTSDYAFTLWGVENKSLYWKAVEAYKAVAKDREKYHAYLGQVENTISSLKSKLFSEPLIAFDNKRASYLKGAMTLTEYYEVLSAKAGEENVVIQNFPHIKFLKELKEKESAIDFQKANLEQAEAASLLSQEDIEKLKGLSQAASKSPFKMSHENHKEQMAFYALLEEKINEGKGQLAAASPPSLWRGPEAIYEYPELKKYFEYLKLAQKINPEAILKEEKLLENEIYLKLAKTADERVLYQVSENTRFLKELFSLTLTPEEYNLYESQKRTYDIAYITGFLNRKIMDLGCNYERALLLPKGYEAYIEKAETFYRLTYERDKAFIENIEKKMTEDKENTAILITGGYHTPNLKSLLKKNNFSYIIYTPQVYHQTNQKRYESILLGQLDKKDAERPIVSLNNKEPKNIMTLPAMEALWLSLLLGRLGVPQLALRGGDGGGASLALREMAPRADKPTGPSTPRGLDRAGSSFDLLGKTNEGARLAVIDKQIAQQEAEVRRLEALVKDDLALLSDPANAGAFRDDRGGVPLNMKLNSSNLDNARQYLAELEAQKAAEDRLKIRLGAEPTNDVTEGARLASNSLTRRSFLQRAMAVAGALGLGGPAAISTLAQSAQLPNATTTAPVIGYDLIADVTKGAQGTIDLLKDQVGDAGSSKVASRSLSTTGLLFTASSNQSGLTTVEVTLTDARGKKIKYNRNNIWMTQKPQRVLFKLSNVSAGVSTQGFNWNQIQKVEITGGANFNLMLAELVDMKKKNESGTGVGMFGTGYDTSDRSQWSTGTNKTTYKWMDRRLTEKGTPQRQPVSVLSFEDLNEDNPELEGKWAALKANDQLPHVTLQFKLKEDDSFSTPKIQAHQKAKTVLRGVAGGDYDEVIRQWAKRVKAHGSPMLLRIFHEFNGNWYPWSVFNAEDEKAFVEAWKRVRKIFKDEGAVNAVWVFSPFATESRQVKAMQQEDYGVALRIFKKIKDQVDIIGIDAYQRDRGNAFLNELITGLLETFSFRQYKKPFILAEFSAADESESHSAGKTNKDLFWEYGLQDLQNLFPEIVAMFIFSITKREDDRRYDFRPSTDVIEAIQNNTFYSKDPLTPLVEQILARAGQGARLGATPQATRRSADASVADGARLADKQPKKIVNKKIDSRLESALIRLHELAPMHDFEDLANLLKWYFRQLDEKSFDRGKALKPTKNGLSRFLRNELPGNNYDEAAAVYCSSDAILDQLFIVTTLLNEMGSERDNLLRGLMSARVVTTTQKDRFTEVELDNFLKNSKAANSIISRAAITIVIERGELVIKIVGNPQIEDIIALIQEIEQAALYHTVYMSSGNYQSISLLEDRETSQRVRQINGARLASVDEIKSALDARQSSQRSGVDIGSILEQIRNASSSDEIRRIINASSDDEIRMIIGASSTDTDEIRMIIGASKGVQIEKIINASTDAQIRKIIDASTDTQIRKIINASFRTQIRKIINALFDDEIRKIINVLSYAQIRKIIDASSDDEIQKIIDASHRTQIQKIIDASSDDQIKQVAVYLTKEQIEQYPSQRLKDLSQAKLTAFLAHAREVGAETSGARSQESKSQAEEAREWPLLGGSGFGARLAENDNKDGVIRVSVPFFDMQMWQREQARKRREAGEPDTWEGLQPISFTFYDPGMALREEIHGLREAGHEDAGVIATSFTIRIPNAAPISEGEKTQGARLALDAKKLAMIASGRKEYLLRQRPGDKTEYAGYYDKTPTGDWVMQWDDQARSMDGAVGFNDRAEHFGNFHTHPTDGFGDYASEPDALIQLQLENSPEHEAVIFTPNTTIIYRFTPQREHQFFLQAFELVMNTIFNHPSFKPFADFTETIAKVMPMNEVMTCVLFHATILMLNRLFASSDYRQVWKDFLNYLGFSITIIHYKSAEEIDRIEELPASSKVLKSADEINGLMRPNQADFGQGSIYARAFANYVAGAGFTFNVKRSEQVDKAKSLAVVETHVDEMPDLDNPAIKIFLSVWSKFIVLQALMNTLLKANRRDLALEVWQNGAAQAILKIDTSHPQIAQASLNLVRNSFWNRFRDKSEIAQIAEAVLGSAEMKAALKEVATIPVSLSGARLAQSNMLTAMRALEKTFGSVLNVSGHTSLPNMTMSQVDQGYPQRLDITQGPDNHILISYSENGNWEILLSTRREARPGQPAMDYEYRLKWDKLRSQLVIEEYHKAIDETDFSPAEKKTIDNIGSQDPISALSFAYVIASPKDPAHWNLELVVSPSVLGQIEAAIREFKIGAFSLSLSQSIGAGVDETAAVPDDTSSWGVGARLAKPEEFLAKALQEAATRTLSGARLAEIKKTLIQIFSKLFFMCCSNEMIKIQNAIRGCGDASVLRDLKDRLQQPSLADLLQMERKAGLKSGLKAAFGVSDTNEQRIFVEVNRLVWNAKFLFSRTLAHWLLEDQIERKLLGARLARSLMRGLLIRSIEILFSIFFAGLLPVKAQGTNQTGAILLPEFTLPQGGITSLVTVLSGDNVRVFSLTNTLFTPETVSKAVLQLTSTQVFTPTFTPLTEVPTPKAVLQRTSTTVTNRMSGQQTVTVLKPTFTPLTEVPAPKAVLQRTTTTVTNGAPGQAVTVLKPTFTPLTEVSAPKAVLQRTTTTVTNSPSTTKPSGARLSHLSSPFVDLDGVSYRLALKGEDQLTRTGTVEISVQSKLARDSEYVEVARIQLDVDKGKATTNQTRFEWDADVEDRGWNLMRAAEYRQRIEIQLLRDILYGKALREIFRPETPGARLAEQHLSLMEVRHRLSSVLRKESNVELIINNKTLTAEDMATLTALMKHRTTPANLGAIAGILGITVGGFYDYDVAKEADKVTITISDYSGARLSKRSGIVTGAFQQTLGVPQARRWEEPLKNEIAQALRAAGQSDATEVVLLLAGEYRKSGSSDPTAFVKAWLKTQASRLPRLKNNERVANYLNRVLEAWRAGGIPTTITQVSAAQRKNNGYQVVVRFADQKHPKVYRINEVEGRANLAGVFGVSAGFLKNIVNDSMTWDKAPLPELTNGTRLSQPFFKSVQVFLAITFAGAFQVIADTVRFAYDKARSNVVVLVNNVPQPLRKLAGVNYQTPAFGRHITYYTEGRMAEMVATLLPSNDPVLRELGLSSRGRADGDKLLKAGIFHINLTSVPLEDAKDIEGFKKILRRAHELYGIKAVMGHWAGLWPQPGSPALSENTPENRAEVMQSVMNMVKLYANESFVLYWLIGRENNYYAGGQFGNKLPLNQNDYYEFMGQLAVAAKWQERQLSTPQKPVYHPVILSNGGLTVGNARKIRQVNEALAAELDGEKPIDGIGGTFYPGLNFGSETVTTNGVAPAYQHFYSIAHDEAGLPLYVTEGGVWAQTPASTTQVDYAGAMAPAFTANHWFTGLGWFGGFNEDWKPKEAGPTGGRQTEGQFGLFDQAGNPKLFAQRGGFTQWAWDNAIPGFEKPAELKPFTRRPSFIPGASPKPSTAQAETQTITITGFQTWSGNGAFSTYKDMRADLSKYGKIRLTFDTDDAGKKFMIRLLPANGDFNFPQGLIGQVFTVPAKGVLEIDMPKGTGAIKQFSVHTGQVFSPARVVGSGQLVPVKVEILPSTSGARMADNKLAERTVANGLKISILKNDDPLKVTIKIGDEAREFFLNQGVQAGEWIQSKSEGRITGIRADGMDQMQVWLTLSNGEVVIIHLNNQPSRILDDLTRVFQVPQATEAEAVSTPSGARMATTTGSPELRVERIYLQRSDRVVASELKLLSQGPAFRLSIGEDLSQRRSPMRRSSRTAALSGAHLAGKKDSFATVKAEIRANHRAITAFLVSTSKAMNVRGERFAMALGTDAQNLLPATFTVSEKVSRGKAGLTLSFEGRPVLSVSNLQAKAQAMKAGAKTQALTGEGARSLLRISRNRLDGILTDKAMKAYLEKGGFVEINLGQISEQVKNDAEFHAMIRFLMETVRVEYANIYFSGFDKLGRRHDAVRDEVAALLLSRPSEKGLLVTARPENKIMTKVHFSNGDAAMVDSTKGESVVYASALDKGNAVPDFAEVRIAAALAGFYAEQAVGLVIPTGTHPEAQKTINALRDSDVLRALREFASDRSQVLRMDAQTIHEIFTAVNTNRNLILAIAIRPLMRHLEQRLVALQTMLRAVGAAA